ncbi:MAG: hypothetical protein IJO00_01260 [Clostridia bacterium]|nr:hypothetical protein [Clostridia bacterium]
MIIEEDGYTLVGRCELILPLGLTLSKKGERNITYFSEALCAAEYLDKLPDDEIFTEKTIDTIKKMLTEKFSSFGYDLEVVLSTVFRLDNRDKINKSLILPSTEPLLPEHGYENLTDCEPDPLGEGLLCFGTVIDEKIVSAAAENPHDADDKVIDIGVETAPGYEGRGFAASNIASLAYYLLDPGMSVTYIAEENNLPSLRVAEKVGFSPSTRELRVVCYLK